MPHDAEIRSLVEQACVENGRDLRAFLIGVLRDRHLAEDAYQRMVVKALEAADSVNPERVRGWLFQIALNEGRELMRQSARQARLLRSVESVFSGETDVDAAAARISSEEETTSIRKALQRLSDNYREVVVRRIQRGQTFAEIAKDMERPLGTILTWMRRALAQLSEMKELQAHRPER